MWIKAESGTLVNLNQIAAIRKEQNWNIVSDDATVFRIVADFGGGDNGVYLVNEKTEEEADGLLSQLFTALIYGAPPRSPSFVCMSHEEVG